MDWITTLSIIASVASITGLILTFYQIRQGNKQKSILSLSSANGKTLQLKLLYTAVAVSLIALGGNILSNSYFQSVDSEENQALYMVYAYNNSSIAINASLSGKHFNETDDNGNNSTKNYSAPGSLGSALDRFGA